MGTKLFAVQEVPLNHLTFTIAMKTTDQVESEIAMKKFLNPKKTPMNPTPQPAWEEQFSQRWNNPSETNLYDSIKAFIRSLLKEETADKKSMIDITFAFEAGRRDMLREVIAVIPETLDKPFGNEGVRHGWDTVRRIIIKRITKLTSEL